MRFGMHTVKGFTIVELIVVMAITGIIAVIAVPKFTSVMDSNNLNSEVNRLVESITTSRSKALVLKVRTTLFINDNSGSVDNTTDKWMPSNKVFFNSGVAKLIFMQNGALSPTIVTPFELVICDVKRTKSVSVIIERTGVVRTKAEVATC